MARNLLNRSYEILGLDQKIWAKLETGGYGESSASGLPTGSDAIEHISFNSKFEIPRENSAGRSGRSVAVRLSGKKQVEMSLESYIIANAPNTLGQPTLPPLHAFFLSAFGNVDLSDPTKIIYKLSALSDKSIKIIEEATHYSRVIHGAVVETATWTLAGDGKAMFKAEGFAQDVYVAGESNLAQATTGAAQVASAVIQDLTYNAQVAGSSGNLITINYIGGGTAGSEVVTVTGTNIVVQIENGVSTAQDIKNAIDGFPAASALVSVSITGLATNTQNTLTSAVHLSGGLNANEIKVALSTGELFEVGSYIDIIDENDGNTAYLTAAKVIGRGTGVNKDILALNVPAVPAIASNRIVIGHAPATYQPTSSENALVGLKGSVTFAGFPTLACEVISAEITLTNNFTKKDFLYGTSKSCGYIPDKRREVKLKLSVLLTKDNFTLYMRNKQFIAEDIKITLEPQDIPAPQYTSSQGRTFEFHFPKVEFNVPPIEQPSDKYVTLELEGIAMATDLNNLDSEFTLTIK
jgi:hypothetical protein